MFFVGFGGFSIFKNSVAIRLAEEAAVLLGFGFVFARLQAALGMLPRSSLAKTPKLLAAERQQYFLKRSKGEEAGQESPASRAVD